MHGNHQTRTIMQQQGIRRYPVGIQTFSELRRLGYLYIDKTAYVYRMAYANSKYQFLSRPRRFGKSLFVSTLYAFFEGRKELFKGLAIEQLEQEWQAYPVLHFDMSQGKHMDRKQLENYLHFQLSRQERKFGISTDLEDSNIRLTNLIQCVYQQTGRQVVVLIDEYDAPLLDVVHEETDLPVLRNFMRNFYSPLKGCDPYLRFVFLTGITKFSQLSIFSELNNIQNISMLPEYAAVCGITQEELETQMNADVDALSARLGQSREETLQRLKDRYDGYHFTWPSSDVYNPFSLLNAFNNGNLDSYWFGSGTPTYLIEMLRKYHVLPQQIGGREALATTFDAPTERMTDIAPLLYQSGYITITGYSATTRLYRLDIPNREVRMGLMESLLPNYVHEYTSNGLTTVALFYGALYHEDMDGALRLLQQFLSTVPYCDHADYEGHYQQLLYVIFSLLGMYVDVEVRTPRGRVDMVLRTATTLYVVELKLDQSAGAAMQQIDLKDYPERFALCGLPVVKVGINFDRERRTISDWVIVPA